MCSSAEGGNFPRPVYLHLLLVLFVGATIGSASPNRRSWTKLNVCARTLREKIKYDKKRSVCHGLNHREPAPSSCPFPGVSNERGTNVSKEQQAATKTFLGSFCSSLFFFRSLACRLVGRVLKNSHRSSSRTPEA